LTVTCSFAHALTSIQLNVNADKAYEEINAPMRLKVKAKAIFLKESNSAPFSV